ncbi:MAG: hypothetical protein ACREX9_06740 [Gammaproteobacteria bacterium]
MSYCSTGCRRLAEFAIRRVNRRLETLESRLSEFRLCPENSIFWMEDSKDEAILRIQGEIKIQNDLLRELLGE